MAVEVKLPRLGQGMEAGTIVRWLKSEGDDVSNGDVLAEIETDKATMELVARGDGVLRKIFVEAGGTAPVGSDSRSRASASIASRPAVRSVTVASTVAGSP